MLYRKKPVTIEAYHFKGKISLFEQLIKEESDIPTWILSGLFDDTINFDDELLVIETMEGDLYATPGDYIIKGVKGEIYPCKEDIFKETYEKV